MIAKDEYEKAVKQKAEASRIITQFLREEQERFEERMRANPIFTDDELRYSAETLCPCGHGMAYPKGCSMHHHWDCSAILKGIADKRIKHTDQLPFVFYDIKSESEHRGSTRGVFRPKAEKTDKDLDKRRQELKDMGFSDEQLDGPGPRRIMR